MTISPNLGDMGAPQLGHFSEVTPDGAMICSVLVFEVEAEELAYCCPDCELEVEAERLVFAPHL